MPLTATLDASFSADGFDLDASFSGLGGLLEAVGLPTLSFAGDLGDLDLDSLDLDDLVGSLTTVIGHLDGVIGALPDLDAVLGPLRSALAVLELAGSGDFTTLVASLETAVGPSESGLPALFDAAGHIGELPAVRTVIDIIGPLGLDLRAPGALVGGPAGGLISLVQLVGALLGVDTASREIDERAALAVDMLSADRITGLISSVSGGRGASLAGLLDGIDPNDPRLVEIVAGPIETHLADVRELLDLLVRGLAYAEATLVDADFEELAAGLTLASVALTVSASAPVDAFVATLRGYAQPLVDLQVPALGVDAVWGASAALASQMEALIAEVEPTILRRVVDPVLDPVLAPLRLVRQALDELAAVLATVFDPVSQAIDAIDLSAITGAITSVVEPVQAVVDTVGTMIEDATTEVQGVVGTIDGLLQPVRDALTEAASTVTAPFQSVSAALDELDLDVLMARITETLTAVTDTLSSVPVRPVFDVASDVIGTTADALGLVPKALLPDDLKAALEAACAPVEALDLEPIRAELHAQLTAIVEGLDTTVLDALEAGYAEVMAFIASIDPRPPLAELEDQAFAALVDGLDQLDPSVVLEPLTAALETVRGALDAIDLRAMLEPVDEAIDTVVDALEEISPGQLLAPVTEMLDGVRGQIDATLQLSTWGERLDDVETLVTDLATRFDPAPFFAAMREGWSDVMASLRPQPGGTGLAAGLAGAVVGALPYRVNPGGIAEVVAWIRGTRDGAQVVQERLARGAAALVGARTSVERIDVRALTVELDAGHRALTAAVAAHPADSVLATRLGPMLAASSPTASMALVLGNVDRVITVVSSSAAIVAATTPPDRSEVSVAASGLAASFGPLAPVVSKVRELLATAGADPDEPNPVIALIDALETAGADAVLGPIEAIATSIFTRLVELVREGLFAPLREGIVELEGLLDLLDVAALTAGVDELHEQLVTKIEELRPQVALAAPLDLLDDIRTTLAAFDPFAPVQGAIDDLRALIVDFVGEFAPTVVLAPVLTVYDQLRSLVGSFDLAGLLDPVFALLQGIGSDIDAGMNEVIDALIRLQEACESDGGPIPGLDLSIAASVDVGGAFGL